MEKTQDFKHFARKIGQAIGTVRRQRGWSQETLATRTGQTTKAIAKFESGSSDLRLSTVFKLANALDLTPGQLIDTEPDGTTGRTVRKRGALLGIAATGWTRVAPTTPHAVPVLDLQPRAGKPRERTDPLNVAWALPPPNRHITEGNLFLAQIRGDSMTPSLHDGDWCLFSRTFTDHDWLGSRVLLREADGTGLAAWTVKRVKAIQVQEDDRRTVTLASTNPDYADRELALNAGGDDWGGDAAIFAVLKEVLLARATGRAKSPV